MPAALVTLDGEPPNGGVVPGRHMIPVLPTVEEPPNGGYTLTRRMPVSDSFPAHVSQKRQNRSECQTSQFNNIINVIASPPLEQRVPAVASSEREGERTHTWVKFFEDGSRPCDAFPRRYQFEIRPASKVLPKDLSMREFLSQLGTPQQAGYGVQQVFPQGDGVWGAGQIFEWGIGNPTDRLGSTELGRGVVGKEVWIVKWAADY